MRRTSLTALLILCLLLCCQGFAQKFTGNIRGTVTDRSGAVVPNAQVTVTDPATGVTRSTTTNDNGEYAVLELPVGTYNVSVKQGQFKEFVTQAVAIHVSTTTTINAQLTPGMATEQVTVEAGTNAVQVETTSAAVGEVVNGQQVRELPLNGRSFAQLTQLQPGVSPANNFDSKNKGLLAGVDFSVNGNPTTNNLFLVDGANNNDVGSNRTILIYPSVESISEFKMLRNSYGPEYGQASGAVINIATRSGSNAFHGSAFYFGRNDLLNAHEYFAARATAAAAGAGVKLPNNGKDVLRRNDYGYSIGGPVKKDKLFFFWSQEWNKEKRGATRQSCVPTAAELTGDFSQGVSCGAPVPHIPGTTTPLLHIVNPSPAGLLMAQIFPTPNLPTPLANGNNWSQSLTSSIDWRQESARADFNLTKSNVIMFRYTQDHWQNPAPNLQGFWGDDPFPAIEGSWNQPSKQIVGKLTSTLTSTMVNDAAFAYSNNRINITTGGLNPGLEAQISAAVPTIFPENLKNKSIGQPTIWGGIGPYGNGTNIWLISPWDNALDIYTFRDDLSKVHGAHTFKMGFFSGFDGKNEDVGPAGQERPAFGGAESVSDTGNALANLLNPGTLYSMGESSTNTRVKLRWRDYEAYFGDTWRARRNLTLELGVRWSSLNSPFQAADQLTLFDPTLYDPTKPASDACNGLRIVAGTDPCGDSNKQFGTNFSSGVPGPGRSLINNNHHMFAPRLGLSYDPKGDGNTAIRVGLGQFFQRERVSTAFVGAANAPFTLAANGVVRTLDANAPTGVPSASPAGGRDPADLIPNSWQWNLSVEHAFAKDTALEVGYIGNRGIHLTSFYDINQVPVQLRTQEAFCSACNNFRPFSNFGTLTWWTHGGDSYYHALQTMFRTRSKYAQIQAAYTWSHSIANVELDNSSGSLNTGAFTDITNTSVDRGNSAINRPHIFVVNAILNGPEFKGQNGFVKTSFGGWEFGVISTAASGNSTSVFVNGVGDINAGTFAPGDPCNGHASDPGCQGLNSLTGTGFNQNNRPNLTGTSCNAGQSGDQIFNPAAFSLNGYVIGTNGNAPRGYCEGPKLFNTDFALYKNFQPLERLRVQFRLEAFNVFNHANFRGDQINNDLLAGVKVQCGNFACTPTNNLITSTNTAASTFGQARQTRGPREIQYALKFIF
jgi:hypothetical protein